MNWIIIVALITLGTLAAVGVTVVWIMGMIADDEEWHHDAAERRDGLRDNE